VLLAVADLSAHSFYLSSGSGSFAEVVMVLFIWLLVLMRFWGQRTGSDLAIVRTARGF